MAVSPSVNIVKANEITLSMSIPENDFKASWNWLCGFRMRKGRTVMLIGTIHYCWPSWMWEYDPEHVYNMDETGLFPFFCIVPRYTLVLQCVVDTIRGTKEPKERLLLLVCAYAT